MTKTNTAEFDAPAQQIAANYAGRIAVQIVSGNAEAAHALVDEGLEAMNTGECPDPLDMTLWELGIDTRMIGYLDFESDPDRTETSVLYVRDLVKFSPEDLLALPNVGQTLLRDLVRCLARVGLKLAQPVGV